MSRPFIEVLADLEGGNVVNDLTAALAELTSQVMAVRKGGALTLKISILPNGETSIEVRADIKVKEPDAPRERTILFADEFGALRRENPRQFNLQLREVEKTPLKDISNAR